LRSACLYNISLSVCLSVCLSVRISRKPHVQNSPNLIFCRPTVPCLWAWLSPPVTAMLYVMYFRFCGRRNFCTYNGSNRPVSDTTRMFGPVRQVAVPGAKSAVSDCILLQIMQTLRLNKMLYISRANLYQNPFLLLKAQLVWIL